MGELIETFGSRFSDLDHRSRALIEITPQDKLFWKPRGLSKSMTMFSCGEYILRSTAMVEKTFGGITRRLWDDPFEWTLPQDLSMKQAVLEYLTEVEQTRVKGLSFFSSDDDLLRRIPAPEKLRSIFDILLEAVAHAEHFQGRAFAVFQMCSDEKLPKL
jgi:hypothetical protein